MKNQYKILKLLGLLLLASPLYLSWLPSWVVVNHLPVEVQNTSGLYFDALFVAFKELSITLVATIVFAMILSVLFGYVSVWSMTFGRGLSNVLNVIESVPSILIALFMYVPVSGFLASHHSGVSSFMSLFVFILAATLTILPESVRSITIPLADLYNRKYSISFRSYGFPKGRILAVLMRTDLVRNALNRVAAGILLKTLVLDCSFGFILQLGYGANGTPAHQSPGALIATYRSALMGQYPQFFFWVPTAMLVMINIAFLIVLNDVKEE